MYNQWPPLIGPPTDWFSAAVNFNFGSLQLCYNIIYYNNDFTHHFFIILLK